MDRDPHYDDMDDMRDLRWPLVILSIVAIAGIAWSCMGCAHASPSPEEVIPCTPVTIYPPALTKDPRPELKSANWSPDEVLSSPASFAKAVAEDMAKWIGWALSLEAEIDKSNVTRPAD